MLITLTFAPHTFRLFQVGKFQQSPASAFTHGDFQESFMEEKTSTFPWQELGLCTLLKKSMDGETV